MVSDAEDQWRELSPSYRQLINNRSASSSFLREIGLKPTVKRLMGDCSALRVLDVGAGDGWLYKSISVGEAFACDLVAPVVPMHEIEFRVADAASLPWDNQFFDVVVSNLMLCYCEDITSPLREMARVCRRGGKLLISLVHPYFYRTGYADRAGPFTIDKDLATPASFEINIGEHVGPFRYFYRPYPDYLNAMLQADWRLTRVEDWFVDEHTYRTAFPDDDGVVRSTRVPIFSFFLAERA